MAITISPVLVSQFTGQVVSNTPTMTWPDNFPAGEGTGGIPNRRQFAGGYTLIPGMINKWTAPTRAIGTIYTNNTGYPLAVAITLVAAPSEYLTFYINGIEVFNPYHGGYGGNYMLCTIISPGNLYSVGPNHALQSWYELRIG